MIHNNSEWPYQAYAKPVNPEQDPWDVTSLHSPDGLMAPPNPSDLEIDTYRHQWHKDENSSVMYDERGQEDMSQGMNTLLDGTYQQPSRVQPGIGNVKYQGDSPATSAKDDLDDWPHLVDMMAMQGDAVSVRVDANRDLFLHTHYIAPSVVNSISTVQILGRDPRRNAVTILNASSSTVFLIIRNSDAQNLPSGGSVGSGPIFALVPNVPVRIQYDGDMYAANPSTGTPAYVSLAVERDR